LPETEQKYFRPAVINESIKDGRLADVAYIFYPHGKTLPSITSEGLLKKYVKTYYNDILKNKKQMLLKRARVKVDTWWFLTEHRAWQEEKAPKLVSTYFGNAGSFAWDRSGKYVVVQGHGWLPKLRKSYSKLPEPVGLAYLAILSSSIVDELLSAVSNHTGGGQWNLSKMFIEKMPLPDLLSGDIDSGILTELTHLGALIKDGKEFDKANLNELVSVIYGIQVRLF